MLQYRIPLSRPILTSTEIVVPAQMEQDHIGLIKVVGVADGITVEARDGDYGDTKLKHHAEYHQGYFIPPGIPLENVLQIG